MSTPTISASRLGRYLTASAMGRRSLALGAQRAEDLHLRPYGAATEAAVAFLAAKGNPSVLDEHRARLLAPPLNQDQAGQVQRCLEGLSAVQAMYGSLGLEDVDVQAVEAPDVPEVNVRGVVVKLRPDAILRARGRRGEMRLGLLKLYFSQSEPYPAMGAEYATTLLALYASRHLGALGTVDPKLVRLVDVFAGCTYTAPKASSRRLAHMEAACEELSGRWRLH